MNVLAGRNRARRQAGSAALLAVAVIVIAGFLGTALLSSALVGHAAVADYVVGVQAFYTADAGIEWACEQDAATTSPLTFGGGTFEVTADGDQWVSTGTVGSARRVVRCDPAAVQQSGEGNLLYILGSRVGWSWRADVEFLVMNTSNDDITFDKMKVTWDNPTAYFEEIRIRVKNGTNYNRVWRYRNEPDDARWASGEEDSFNRVSSVTIPAHYTAEIKIRSFYSKQTNWGGQYVNMHDTELTVEFYNGSTLVNQIVVGLRPQ